MIQELTIKREFLTARNMKWDTNFVLFYDARSIQETNQKAPKSLD
ncbi:hypothetical protein O77CONTIG1_01857 [Leptolyngbya sp. O-77]|nr:hypothetical protein O77CONTIG1_01857 [Leptolyngbya sp. O-77]